jgi:hypothetical protein
MALELPRSYPFTRLQLVPGEVVLWHGHNPTFHRYVQYGFVVTTEALYWFKSLWSFSRWQRFPLGAICSARFDGSRLRPCVELDLGGVSRKLHTPYDYYADEMIHDRQVLAEGVDMLNQHLRPVPPSVVPSNISLQADRER